jgi:hypothetical protein
MTNPSGFLRGDPDELGELLLQVARRERAPHAARERALSSVAAVSLGAAVATTAKASLAVPVAGTPAILAAKWLVIGLAGALVGLTAIDQAQRALAPVADPLAPPVAAARPAQPDAAQGLSSASPVVVEPVPNAASSSAPTLAVTPNSSTSHAVDLPSAAQTPGSEPSAAAFDVPNGAQLAREVAALRQARAALAQGKPGRALEILAAHHREFPVGVLGIEEAAMRIEIAFAIGDGMAPELGRRFLAQYPTSPLAARVRGLLDAKSTSHKKP